MIVRQITFKEALKIAACGGMVGVSIPKTDTPREWGDYEHGSMGDRMTGSLFFEYHMPREGKEATATPVSAKEAVKLAAAGIPVGVFRGTESGSERMDGFQGVYHGAVVCRLPIL